MTPKDTLLCKAWNLISWLFLGIVAAQALYLGLNMGSWMGLVALIVFLTGGFIYGHFRKQKCKTK